MKQSLPETNAEYKFWINPPELIGFQTFPLFPGKILKFEMTQTANSCNLRRIKALS